MFAKMSTQGRITLPAEIRKRFGIKAGTRIVVREVNGSIVLMPFDRHVRSLRGMLKGKNILKMLESDREQESIL